MSKTDNRQKALSAKVALRSAAIEHVKRARVLDVFAGIDGVMHDLVWRRAEFYAGIDIEYQFSQDARRRYVGDSLRVLRNIDLSMFNIFDVDAYGDPWGALTIIAKRRRWLPGELGAIVITDGGMARTKFGQASAAIAALTGVRSMPSGKETADALRRQCRAAWLSLADVELVAAREAISKSGDSGGSLVMAYTLLAIQGRAAEVLAP